MIHLPVYTAIWLAGAIMLASVRAHAAGVAGIGNATVNQGQFTLSLREAFGTDNDNRGLDNRWRQRIMTDYGFTDWFASGLYLQGDKRGSDNMEYEALIWDSRFELTEVKEHGFYSGFRIRYTYRDNDKKPDNLHLRAIVGMPVGRWEFRYNQIFYTDLGTGSRAGLGLDTRMQVTYEYTPGHRAGVESFLDTGRIRDFSGYDNKGHDMGFVFTGSPSPDWSYETGYAYGITQTAPDHTFKLFINRNF